MAELSEAVLAISAVTVGEMRRGAIEAAWGERRRRALEDHMRTYLILPIDSEVADEWARLAARCTELGRAKRDNDLWIAATARRHGFPLAALDFDYEDMPGTTLIRRDGRETVAPP